ncbi:octaprenyl diphosphate synthase [Sodalis sp. CWE]|uniref:octaprenyl diphosphate synthase n=1 Tax=Sodalis sp. CWE TaxID=2803816 RepID=UPI001C7CCF0D|nr:octaprenyl diphosphate synthase [Sodalis sp. CWE]MBX4180797.1 octaprenyl diphosphate synthase [Sodalis sp. CWE]
MNLQQINKLTAQDMAEVNTIIHRQIKSDIALIDQLGHYIISSGGKRIRPMIAVLIARALHYQGKQHITVAALIEFIHTATLLHDDVVDKSNMRRGKATANAEFGNAASVLVGDFIYTRAFQMMTTLESLRVLKLMSEAVNIIAEGEVLQLMNCHDPDITINDYMRIVYSKTARLFEVAAQASSILAGANEYQESKLCAYGRHLGAAFQLINDLLDYSTDCKFLGKDFGSDLNEGKSTLPLLHSMQNSKPEQAALIRNAIKTGKGRHLMEFILDIMHQCNSLVYTRRCAEKEAKKAIASLSCLSPSPYRDALKSLACVTVQQDL